jgi:RNAse (barnase) inhibitor barstar
LQRIVLDASEWKSFDDFDGSLRRVLGAPDWHGNNVDAFIDSMVYGDINWLESPYTIVIQALDRAPAEVQQEVRAFSAHINRAAAAYHGTEREVGIEIPG